MILEPVTTCSICGSAATTPIGWHLRCEDCQTAIDAEECARLGAPKSTEISVDGVKTLVEDPVRAARISALAAKLGVKAEELTLDVVKAAAEAKL